MKKEEKQAIMRRVWDKGYIISFVTLEALFITNGHGRKKIKWKDADVELEKL